MDGKTHTYGTVEVIVAGGSPRVSPQGRGPNAPFNPQVDVPRPEAMTAAAKFKALWENRDARLRCSEHEEGNYGATLCGRCMISAKPDAGPCIAGSLTAAPKRCRIDMAAP